MKCFRCDKKMTYEKNLKFNSYIIDGWECKSCGEAYYNPEKAEKILLLNKLKKLRVITKLGKIRSNLILRLPKDIETALDLKKGGKVSIKVEGRKLEIVPC